MLTNECFYFRNCSKKRKLLLILIQAESAKAAAHAGVDGIVVSAHGGRQMDGAPAPVIFFVIIFES